MSRRPGPRPWWLALLVALLCAGQAGAATIGLQDDRLPNYRGAALQERLDLLAATGTTLTRVDILWRRVAPARPADPRNPDDPAYDWAAYDEIMLGLAARGIRPILDFYGTPAWASRSGHPSAAPPPVHAAMFAGAIARRYSGSWRTGSGLLLPEVREIELWNEPNIPLFWRPQCRPGPGRRYVPVAARRYAALADAAVREIRAANPDAIIIGGVTGPSGDLDDRGKICRAGTESVSAATIIAHLRRNRVAIDAWSQHLYPLGPPQRAVFFPSWPTLPRLVPKLDRLRRGMPIYVTETGYHTSYNRYHRYFVSEGQQARWLADTFSIADRTPRVAAAVWFNLQDNPRWTGGLLHADLSRKPAWSTFRALATEAATR